jgi:hypothetical protein
MYQTVRNKTYYAVLPLKNDFLQFNWKKGFRFRVSGAGLAASLKIDHSIRQSFFGFAWLKK